MTRSTAVLGRSATGCGSCFRSAQVSGGQKTSPCVLHAGGRWKLLEPSMPAKGGSSRPRGRVASCPIRGGIVVVGVVIAVGSSSR